MQGQEPFSLNGFRVRLLSPDDQLALQALLEDCSDYSQLVAGHPTGTDAARQLLEMLPPGKTSKDKFTVGLSTEQGKLVGVIDAVRDFPEEGTWYIGLMLVTPQQRANGVGGGAYRVFESWAVRSGALKIMLEVFEQNPKAVNFWKRCGFKVEEHLPPRQFGLLNNRAFLLGREVGQSGSL